MVNGHHPQDYDAQPSAGLLDGILGAFGRGRESAAAVGTSGLASAGVAVGERFAQSAQDAVLGQYPGYGSLWTYSGGVIVTPAGWLAIGGIVAGVYLLTGRR